MVCAQSTGTTRTLFLAAMITSLASGCNGSSSKDCKVDSTYDPTIDPGAFLESVDNPLFPLVPGTVLTYTADAETVVVTVTDSTKVILGVVCTIVRDVASDEGEVIEDTYDYYAQDTTGTVWYMGEDTKELENGHVVSTAGSWEAGVDGAKPGVLIPGHPVVGQEYKQEYYACHAEDMGEVLALDASASVEAGDYTGCLKTHDFTPLEPNANEQKYYAPGVGLVLTVDVSGGGREELISIQSPANAD
jgi:hypothetical protein